MTHIDSFGLATTEWRDLERDSVSLLQRLLQIDTSNPPGNETACALLLKDYLAAADVHAELIGEHANRQSLVARLKGNRPGPTLLYLGHTDVVPVEPDEWSVPPFSGALQGGYVWGRGAVDMKCQVAAEAVAVARLARNGADFAGEIVYAATADEENGRDCGARWLVEQHPELVRCDYLINEGGGTYMNVDDARLFTYSHGEKGFAQFRLHIKGKGGHGSMPLHDHNPVQLMGRVICALADHDLPVALAPSTAQYIDRVVPDRALAARLKNAAMARDAVCELHASGNPAAYLIEPLLGITFSPTIARAGGEAVNVIPSHAELDIDCRILPSQNSTAVLREVNAALSRWSDAWSLEWVDVTEGNESPTDTPLSASLERVLTTMAPDAELAPLHLCGFTDSRWFRERFPSVVAYGFCPFMAEDSTAMGGREHAKDERVPASDVPPQALFFERLALDLLR